jgi:sorting nexin-8
MFNAPRATQRYGGNTSNGFGGSFVDENPLGGSGYDGLDPWSAAPSPTPTPAPAQQATSVFSAVIGMSDTTESVGIYNVPAADATVPPIYNQAFSAVDPDNTGETSLGSLSRVLETSSLPASTIDRVRQLIESKPAYSHLNRI